MTDLLFEQAKVASSILPPQSWAYSPAREYKFDPAKAKQLLQEAGYKNEPIVFKYGSGNLAINQYAQVIQSALTDVGLNVQIETLEVNTIRKQLAQGAVSDVYRHLDRRQSGPDLSCVTCSARPKYRRRACRAATAAAINPEVDKTVEDAINETDKAKAKELYGKTWEIVSSEIAAVAALVSGEYGRF